MSEQINSVDFWVNELTRDTSIEHLNFRISDSNYSALNTINYGQWMWDCGYNEGLVNLQTKVNIYCVPQWISVKSQLPKPIVDVLGYNEEEDWIGIVTYDDEDKRWWCYGRPIVVDWWMELPKKPKEQNNE